MEDHLCSSMCLYYFFYESTEYLFVKFFTGNLHEKLSGSFIEFCFLSVQLRDASTIF
jgi:hypothetical protein